MLFFYSRPINVVSERETPTNEYAIRSVTKITLPMTFHRQFFTACSKSSQQFFFRVCAGASCDFLRENTVYNTTYTWFIVNAGNLVCSISFSGIWLCFHTCSPLTLSPVASIQCPSYNLDQTETSILTATNIHSRVADAEL